MGIVGAAVGISLVVALELRDFRVSPYFWVRIAMAVHGCSDSYRRSF